jgi:hypothetical protein
LPCKFYPYETQGKSRIAILLIKLPGLRIRTCFLRHAAKTGLVGGANLNMHAGLAEILEACGCFFAESGKKGWGCIFR